MAANFGEKITVKGVSAVGDGLLQDDAVHSLGAAPVERERYVPG